MWPTGRKEGRRGGGGGAGRNTMMLLSTEVPKYLLLAILIGLEGKNHMYSDNIECYVHFKLRKWGKQVHLNCIRHMSRHMTFCQVEITRLIKHKRFVPVERLTITSR